MIHASTSMILSILERNEMLTWKGCNSKKRINGYVRVSDMYQQSQLLKRGSFRSLQSMSYPQTKLMWWACKFVHLSWTFPCKVSTRYGNYFFMRLVSEHTQIITQETHFFAFILTPWNDLLRKQKTISPFKHLIVFNRSKSLK